MPQPEKILFTDTEAGISIEKWCEVYEDIANQKIRRTGKSGSPSQEDVKTR